MIIIIEGPDGAGKTTLAEQISRQTKYPIIHRTKPKNEEEKKRMMGEYLQTIRSGKNMIFDRCWYSEMAYGPVMRDSSVISYPQMYELEEQLAKVLKQPYGKDARSVAKSTLHQEITSMQFMTTMCRL